MVVVVVVVGSRKLLKETVKVLVNRCIIAFIRICVDILGVSILLV